MKYKLSVVKKIIILCLAFVCLISLFSCKRGEEVTYELGSGGRVNNTVILVNLGEGEFDEDYAADLSEKLNGEGVSMRGFFLAESLGRCEVNSTVIGEVTVENGRDYYLPDGRNGYDDTTLSGKKHADGFIREQMLIREIISLVEFPEGYCADADGDGVADGITFVINDENPDADSVILWPHKSLFVPSFKLVEDGYFLPEDYGMTVYDVDRELSVPRLSGSEAGQYNIVFKSSTTGEMCHEFSHILGKPDYYSYVKNFIFETPKLDNIGTFELMGSKAGEIPQYSLAYVRFKLGWLLEGKDIAVTDKSGEFSLMPVTRGGVQAIKIVPPNFREKGEFFMIEAREKTSGGYDSSIAGGGIIIYSVRPKNAFIGSGGEYGFADCGNMYGNGRFEIKLVLSSLGLNCFDGSVGRDSVSLKHADGTSASVEVNGITLNEDGSYSFSVTVGETVKESFKPEAYLIEGGRIAVEWQTESDGNMYIMAIKNGSYADAAYDLDSFPSYEEIVRGNSRGLDVCYYGVASAASGWFMPEIKESCYLIVAGCGEYEIFPVKAGGEELVKASFGDWLKVLFQPWKPAFIAGLIVCGLCVLGLVLGVIKAARTASRE